MKNKKYIFLLIIISLIGSFEIFYASNMIFSDVANAFQGLHDNLVIASIPALMVGFDFVLAALYVSRRLHKPTARKIHEMLYAVLLAVNSCIGLVTAILSGVVVYKSFVKPYPFPGYVIWALAVNAILLVYAIIRAAKASKLPKDEDYRKVNFAYGLHMVLLAVFVFLAFNRFGALLWAPTYVQLRTLDMTFVFYLWLLVPIALLAHVAFYLTGAFRRNQRLGILNSILLCVLNIVLGCISFGIARVNTQFISAISPALALERLATMPIDTLIHFVGCFAFSIYVVLFSVLYSKGKGKAFR